MKRGDYPTSSDTKVFINGWHIDDVLRIEWEEQNPKVPISGYNQKHTALVADGKYIITGTILIHFRYPGYLLRAIASTENTPIPETAGEAVVNNTRIADLLNDLRKASPQERVKLLAESPPDRFQVMSSLLEAAYEASPISESMSPVELGPADSWNGSGGFSIEVRYGPDPGVIKEILHGVHLTSCRKVLSASVAAVDIMGGSGQSILEAYSFFARKVDRVLPLPQNKVSPGQSSIELIQ